MWLCRRTPWTETESHNMRNALEELAVTASASSAEPGIEGFRNTLKQAEEAERVRAAWGPLDAPRVISYVDAGLEVLLLHNEELARSFMEHELGPLAEGSTEAARLRQTLEASFRYDSHVAAAEHLQLHEHTVRNRLRKAEEILGHPLHERRTELQVAMRLVRLLRGTKEGESF